MSTLPERPPSKIFHAVTHVWGREYLDLFLDVCIPNQLAPGNVPALPAGSRYRILTRSKHVSELDAHPMVHALRAVIPVDIVVVDAVDRHGDGPHGTELMIACHQKATADILEAGAAIIMLSADFILSATALAAVVRRHREGYRAVVNTGLRLAKESFVPAIATCGVPLARLSSRELVRFALPHLHPHERAMFSDAKRFSKAPVAVFWPVGDEGLLARCLHLHPLMVDPMLAQPLVYGTNDGPYLAQVCPDFSHVHVIADSDELQMFEITTIERQVIGATHAGISSWRAANMASRCDALQLHFWQRHPIRIHAADLDERWIEPALRAERFARRVMRQRPYAKLAHRWLRVRQRADKRRARLSKALYRQRKRVRLELVRKWSDRQVRVWERRRPQLTSKRFQRSVRLLTHRVAKVAGLRLKRLRRRLRLA